jgi:hypothetical protein
LVRLKTEGFRDAPKADRQRLTWSEKTRIRHKNDRQKKNADLNNETSPHKTLDPKDECFSTWEELKRELCKAITLAFSNFSLPFILYVDGSKERGYGVTLHQKNPDGEKRPILFLSKCLTDAETRY